MKHLFNLGDCEHVKNAFINIRSDYKIISCRKQPSIHGYNLDFDFTVIENNHYMCMIFTSFPYGMDCILLY